MNYPPRGGAGFGGFQVRVTKTGRRMMWLYGSIWLGLVVLGNEWLGLRVPIAVGPAGYEVTNGFSLWSALALTPPSSVTPGGPGFHVWQLVTSHFVHDPRDVLGLLFNLLAFYFFAGTVEEFLGRRRFLTLWVVSAVAAALGASLMGVLQSPPLLHGGIAPGILALVVVYCFMMPDAIIHLFFVLPLKARWVGVGTGALTVLFALAQPQVYGGWTLGGLAGGWVWWRYGESLDPRTLLLRRKLKRAQRKQGHLVVLPGGQGDDDKPVYH